MYGDVVYNQSDSDYENHLIPNMCHFFCQSLIFCTITICKIWALVSGVRSWLMQTQWRCLNMFVCPFCILTSCKIWALVWRPNAKLGSISWPDTPPPTQSPCKLQIQEIWSWNSWSHPFPEWKLLIPVPKFWEWILFNPFHSCTRILRIDFIPFPYLNSGNGIFPLSFLIPGLWEWNYSFPFPLLNSQKWIPHIPRMNSFG